MNLITYQWHKKEIKTSNKINRRGRDGGYIYLIYQNWRVGGWGWGVEEAEYGLTTEQPEYWLYFLDWR